MYVIKNALSVNGGSMNSSTPLAVSLYQKQIEPILSYGCALWAVPKVNNCISIKLDKLDWFATVGL